MTISDDRQAAIERLQQKHGSEATPEQRKDFMRRIANVPKEELETAPEPPKKKRGRPRSAKM